MEELKAILSKNTRCNTWLRIDEYHMNLYTRLTKRFLNSVMVDTLDIATVEIDSNHQRKGNFTAFINEAEKLADLHNRVIFVESICNKALWDFLLNRGYQTIETIPTSLYRETNPI